MTKIMSESVGKRITEALNTIKMTQKELASRIGVTEAVISQYISGDRDPKPDMLANIATVLNTTSDFLLGIERDELNHARSYLKGGTAPEEKSISC